MRNYKNILNTIMPRVVFIFLIFLGTKLYAQPPACTQTITSGSNTYVVNSGETYCFPEGTSYNGTITVNPGGNILICESDFYGSVTVYGYLWQTSGVTVYGSYFYAGQGISTDAANCCAALSPGSIGSDQTICSGATPSALTNSSSATGGNGSFSYQWQISTTSAAAGFSDISGATSATYSPGALTQDTWYRRKVTSCSGSSTQYTSAIKITITALPTVTGSTGGSRCGTGTVSISASASAGSIEWFTASSGGVSIGSSSSGANWTTPSISSTTTYYAEAVSGTCRSASRTAVTATVNANPTANAGAALSSICQSGTSAAMGGSVGGSATGGTWSGGAGSWTNANNPSTATYTAGAGESGSITLTLTTSGGSCGTTTATKNITVNANPTANAGGALSAICQSSTSAAMGGSVGGGATGGTWSGGAGSWTNASNPSTATYTAGAGESGSITLTLTTSGGSCGTTTATKNITVNANATVNVGGALSAICQSGTSAAMGGSVGGSATGGTWSGGAGSWTNASNPSTATYTASAGESGTITLTLTTSGGSCGTSSTKTITVNANPTVDAGGALSAICQSSTSAAMGGSVGGGATGGTWSGGAGSWTNASNPSTATYTAGAGESGSITLTLTTSGGSCGTTTATKNITVNPSATVNVGGALAAICQGGTSAAMGGSVGGSATGGTWSGGAGSWTNANNPSTATYTASAGESGTITLTLTTSGGSCGTSSTKTITVNATSVGGTISSDASVCSGSNGATLTLSGNTGTVTKWQYSTDNWTTPVDISNTTTSQAYLNLTATTKYRAVVQSGVCSAANSSDVTITVQANRTVGAASTASQTVCYNTAITNITHATTDVTGITSSTGLPTGISASYNANVITISGTPTQSGTFNYTITPTSTCGSATATGQIIVHDDFSAGAIGSAQIIPINSIPSALSSTTNASGGGGFTYQWQISTDNVSWGDIVGATSSTYTPPSAITQDTWYRRAAISTAGCGTLYTASIKVSVAISVCTGQTPPAVTEQTAASGGVGGFTYQWQKSTDGVVFSNIVGATSTTYTPTAISSSTWYRRCVTSGSCTECTDPVKASVSSSPGSVSSGLLVWLKADAGTSDLATQWEDQSGNGNHYTTVAGPTLSSGNKSSNYNPYITINSGGFVAPVGAQLGNNYTIFTVAKKLDTDYDGRIFDGHTGNHYWGYVGQDANDTIKKLQVFSSSSGSANGVRLNINQGANSASESSHSIVYELIIYNSVLSSSEIEIIESYLNTKYGITNNNSFLSSLGSETYDDSGDYTHDIIGIGKECYFHQKQSKSLDDSTYVFIGTLAANNSTNAGTISNDISYLMIGHNGGLLKGTAASKNEIPAAGTDGYTVTSRIDREWQIQNTNFNNAYTFKTKIDIPLDSIDITHLALLVSNNGDFTNCNVYKHGDGDVTFRKGSLEIDGIENIIGVGGKKFIAIASVDELTVLPIELLYFKAEKSNDNVRLIWKTAAEINNDYFSVEKSHDGISWFSIGELSGAGNSSSPISYELIDFDGCSSTCYYRLKQIDFSGEFTYSNVEYIINTNERKSSLKVYPVPVLDRLTVEFVAPQTDEYNVQIYTSSGALVYAAKLIGIKGENLFYINTNMIAHGMYFMVVKNNNGEIYNRVNFTK